MFSLNCHGFCISEHFELGNQKSGSISEGTVADVDDRKLIYEVKQMKEGSVCSSM